MNKSTKKPDTTQIALMGVLKQQSVLLLVSMFLSFALTFIIETFHYANNIVGENVPNKGYAYCIGIGIATIITFCRVAFGISGAYEFAFGNTAKGILGLLFSFILTVFCSHEAAEIAMFWSLGNADLLRSAQMVLFFIVWAGFVLEIRLAISMSGMSAQKEETESDEVRTLVNESSHITSKDILEPSSNGVIRKNTELVGK